jgi:uncharacterized lipoprotein YmbA
MKRVLPFLILLLLAGCGSKKFYTLGDNLNVTSPTTYHESIDVVKVIVPKYLTEDKIVRQVTPYQIEFIEKAQWLVPMEKKLTDVLIDYLQQSLNNPDVHLYPWESDNKATKRVSIEIKKFIASDKEVTLKANYKIVDLTHHKNKTKLFKTTIPTNNDIHEMLKSMEKAYLELIKNIKTSLIENN